MSLKSSDMIDLLFEKEDCRAAEDSLRSTLFANDHQSLKLLKEEFCDDFDWRNGASDFNVDELLGSCLIDNGLNPPEIMADGTSISDEDQDDNLQEEDFEAFKDIVSLPFDAVMNSFDPGFEAASDSGLSTDNLTDFMLSPSSGSTSPDPRVDISVDTTDTVSDVSSTSDLGSLGSVGSSPSGRSDSSYSFTPIRFDLGSSTQSQYDEDVDMKNLSVQLSEKNHVLINSPKTIIASPQLFTKLATSTTNSTPTSISTRGFKIELTQPTKFIKQVNTVIGSTNNITTTSNLSSNNIATVNTISNISTSSNSMKTRSPIVTKVRLDTSKIDSGCKNGTLKTNSPQTIVVTQPGKMNPFIKNTAFLKAAASGRPILVPVNVNVNDLNQMKQMKSIKIISTSTANNRPGIRTLVSTVRPVSTAVSGTTANRTTTLYTTTSKGSDGRSLIKVTPTAFVTPNSHTEAPHISVTPSYIKEEPSDDETPQPNQELVLTEEEKRLMRKEGLTFPARYPLTKQEERDLKRIRRKIRNKISAQDSRKRKKEYVDGLEDRVKNCTEENQQLQKRIKSLEKQNESILAQLKKFQNIVGLHSRHHNHASTALMMLILSTALFVVPSLRSQDGKGENELAGDSNMPSTGHTRSLLEVKNAALNMKHLDGFPSSEVDDEIDPLDYTNALSDHDYAPFAKKARLENLSPTYYSAPSVDKTLPREKGDPPDTGGLNRIAAMIGAMLDRLGNNWTDPGGSFGNAMNLTPPHGPPERSVVVNLNHGKRLRDDIELE